MMPFNGWLLSPPPPHAAIASYCSWKPQPLDGELRWRCTYLIKGLGGTMNTSMVEEHSLHCSTLGATHTASQIHVALES